MTDADAPLLDRQRQIWANLYGPARAAQLIDLAVQAAADQGTTLAEAVRVVDPEADETYEDFVATRW